VLTFMLRTSCLVFPIVLAQELLMLDREITAFLDAGKANEIATALSTADLPEPGNTKAAKLIMGGLA